ncbi:MAG: IS1182 family transposase [Oscillospiraceae bacterium]|nr:IS1182 family transposase [Oscillospiraceae bacterium]
MKKPNILQPNYTAFEKTYQLRIPFETEILIPQNDSVRLLSQLVEEMDLTGLYDTYSRIGKIEVSPRIMTKVLVYAYMQGIYSSRGIESACRRDINFWYLLEGHDAPDYSTIARFRTLHFEPCAEDVFVQLVQFLKESGEIDCKSIFIDGTKIEANANRYTFVWKKAVTKYQTRLLEKIASSYDEWSESYGLTAISDGDISKESLRKVISELKDICKDEHIEFVNGKGKHKSQLQRDIETAEEYLSKMKEYEEAIEICGQRNSYSKTDHDATFLHMKEDHMRNGQLKPGYNLQVGSDSGYAVWAALFPDPNDTKTLIPFLNGLEEKLKFKYGTVVADSGYESEENYTYLEEHAVRAMIKPANYEISKTRKFKHDISRKENMDYDSEHDQYICKTGKVLKKVYERSKKSTAGYKTRASVYECEDCSGCPFKSSCIKGNNSKTPFEERNKKLMVSRTFEEQRKESLENITTDEGCMLRMNRSIYAEGVFAEIKEDRKFKRYLCRGKPNVLTETLILLIAQNVERLHRKIQNRKTGEHLHPLKVA